MISHTLQFIFIHIPKTSGNSLSLFLKDCISNQVIQKDMEDFSLPTSYIDPGDGAGGGGGATSEIETTK